MVCRFPDKLVLLFHCTINEAQFGEKQLLMVVSLVSQHIYFAECFSMQRHVLSLDGPVVTASGFKDELAIVTHASDCLPSNEQV